MMISSAFVRLVLGSALTFFAGSLTAAPVVLLEKARLVPLDGAPEGGFGRSIAISGDVAVVSANLQSKVYGAGPDEPGAVYVFERNSAGAWRQTAKLTSGVEGDLYGLDVAVDGNVIAVAAGFSRLTHVYEKQNGGWQAVAVLGRSTGGGNGYSVAIENNLLAISHLSSHGMALYRRESTGWVQIANYDNGDGIPDDDYFGPQVDISQNFAIHGSWGSDFFEPPIPSAAFIYYYATARSGGGVQLKRMLAGTFTTLGSASLPVAIGTTDRIRLEAVGDHIRVLVNDRPVIRVRDSALSGGRPGLMTYKTRADFDNVIVNANPGYVAFSDEFDTLNFKWNTVSGNWSPDYINGIRRNTDVAGAGRLLIANAGQGSYGTQGDQIVQADLRPTQFSGADRWVGLIARYRDEGNYHYVTLRSSNALDIKKLVNGSIQTLASVPFTVQANVNYRVRLEVIGTRLRVYVNGTLRAEATDASLTRAVSSAGVATYKAAVDLDNFWVTQP